MLSTVLHTFKNTIEANVRQSGPEEAVKVAYVDLKNKRELLVPDSINLVLFTSTEMKAIMGEPSLGRANSQNQAIQQKAPLKLQLNVLLIFNLNDYLNALDCYGQVLGHFYNNDILDVKSSGYDNPINVLISGFDDRNEIEIRNSFDIPGTPILRYDLLYALVQGGLKRLPVVKNVGLDTGIPDPDEILSTATVNLICNPIENALAIIQQKTGEFSAIQPDGDSTEYFGVIKSAYDALVEKYEAAFNRIVEKSGLQEARPFFFALKKFMSSLTEHKMALHDQWNKLDLSANSSIDDLKYGHEQVNRTANAQVQENKTAYQLFTEQCRVATTYLPITQSIMAGVNNFNTVGHSVYEFVNGDFKQRRDITMGQQKQKWWSLEELLRELMNAYTSPLVNALLDNRNSPCIKLKNELEERKATLKPHLSKINLLNKAYNKLDKTAQEITSGIEQEYFTWYTGCYASVNNFESESISEHLENILEQFLITITKKYINS